MTQNAAGWPRETSSEAPGIMGRMGDGGFVSCKVISHSFCNTLFIPFYFIAPLIRALIVPFDFLPPVPLKRPELTVDTLSP